MGFKEYRERHKYDVIIDEKLKLIETNVVMGMRKYPIAGAKASYEPGVDIAARMTATRVATGAVLLGPLGALLGGMAKKDQAKLFFALDMPDGSIVTHEIKAKHESKVRKLVENINLLSAELAPDAAPSLEATIPPPPPPSVPAGWYPDPQGVQVQRYWDGSKWTEHTAPVG